MALRYRQIRYYFDNDSTNNQPTSLTREQLVGGTAFQNYFPITQLGVQALPGTKMYINGSDNPAIVGFTGIFELDLTDGGEITNLAFDSKSIERIHNTPNASLIVDLVYWSGEG